MPIDAVKESRSEPSAETQRAKRRASNDERTREIDEKRIQEERARAESKGEKVNTSA